MKQIIKLFTICVFFALFTVTVSAQSKEEMKALKKEMKALSKEGWKVNPGNLPLQEQVAESRKILKNQEKWVVGEAKSSGTVYDAARSNALFQAKVNLAKNVDEEFGGKEQGGTGQDNGSENSASATTYRESAKSKFASAVKRPKILMDCYRDLKGGRVEVMIRIAMSADEAEKSYQKIIDEINEMLKK